MRNQFLLVILLLFTNIGSARETHFIQDWLILGAFEAHPGEESLAFEYIQNEALVNGFGGQRVGERRWMLFHSAQNVLNFADPVLKFKIIEQSAAYAQVFVHSKEEQGGRLYLGSDDEVAVWCNQQRIHYNWTQRHHHFDQDTISVNLIPGWNRLLFKVVNGAVAWQLSARIEMKSDIRIQAENPLAIPVEPIKSRNLIIWHNDQQLQQFFTLENEPRIGIQLVLHNESTRKLVNIAVDIKLHNRQLQILPNIPVIQAGELLAHPVALTFQTIDSLLLNDASLKISFSGTGWAHSAEVSMFTVRKILTRLFDSWELNNWSSPVEQENVTYEKEWIVPALFTGCNLNLKLDIGPFQGDCFINRRRKASQFTGYPGNIVLGKKVRANQKISIRVTLQADSIQLQKLKTDPVRAAIIPDYPAMDFYIKEMKFADQIFKKPVSLSPKEEKEIYRSFRANDSRNLKKALKEIQQSLKPIAAQADSHTIVMFGNSHIDVAWLWQYPETVEVCRNTFQAAIDNIKKYPDFIFSHGQALSYWWIEQNYPELFKEIKKYVKKNRWEIVGGTWVEPDLNLSNGESQIRQYLYGKHFFKEKFNIDVKIGWMPDTFGHPATLPQILKKCGIESYSFFRPGRAERFFYWRSKDGSQVLAHRPKNWFGSTKVDENLWKGLWQEKSDFGLTEVARFYGVGDHGGGPTRKSIETIFKLDDCAAFPAVKMRRMDDYYLHIISTQKDTGFPGVKFPVVEAEQNFVFPGCWTSQAKTKWNNRRAENLLSATELFAGLGLLFDYDYPASELRDNWRNVLFNQFHDILAGSSIGPVYEDAERAYREIFENSNTILKQAIQVLASNVNTQFSDSDALPLIVFNFLNWSCTAPVTMKVELLPGMNQVHLFGFDGKEVPVQIIDRRPGEVQIVFVASEIPGLGYSTYWLKQSAEEALQPTQIKQDFTLENTYLKVTLDSKTGTIVELVNKSMNLNLFQGRGCEFQIQADEPENMSAWKMKLRGPVTALNSPQKISVVEDGAIRKVIQVEYQHNHSQFFQKFILYHELPRLDVQVTVNWLERQKILKIAFPIQIERATATYDIPFGTIVRERDGQEVPAQKWIDLSNTDFGITLVNDCKYGFDVKGNVMRMSALRASIDPDSLADLGYHSFSYALFPHPGTWQAAKVNRLGLEFNAPPVHIFTQIHKGTMQPKSSIMKIDAENVVISALKKAENNNDLILRFYETYGQPAQVKIKLPKPAHNVFESDMLEWEKEKLGLHGYKITVPIAPYEIKTLRIQF